VKTPRSKSVQFWATPDEWRRIRAAVRGSKARSLSAWVRTLVLQAAANGANPEQVAGTITERAVAAAARAGGR